MTGECLRMDAGEHLGANLIKDEAARPQASLL